jgi:hypothetical protein
MKQLDINFMSNFEKFHIVIGQALEAGVNLDKAIHINFPANKQHPKDYEGDPDMIFKIKMVNFFLDNNIYDHVMAKSLTFILNKFQPVHIPEGSVVFSAQRNKLTNLAIDTPCHYCLVIVNEEYQL